MPCRRRMSARCCAARFATAWSPGPHRTPDRDLRQPGRAPAATFRRLGGNPWIVASPNRDLSLRRKRITVRPETRSRHLRRRPMLIVRRKGWEIPAGETTPESVFLNRRQIIAAGLAASGAGLIGGPAAASDPTADLYPAKRNESYPLDRAVTPEKYSGDYNNYYELGTSTSISDRAEKRKPRPWSVKIDGLVEKPTEIAIDDLIRKMAI